MERLRAQEKILWDYFELTSIPLKIVGMDHRLTHYNAAFGELLGYQEGQPLARDDMAGLVLAEDIPTVKRAMAEIFEGHSNRTQFEARLIHRNGSFVWAQEIAVPRREFGHVGGNCPEFAIVVTIDVTRRKEMEQRIQQTERMRSIGHLAGSLAHDINNILTVFSFYTEMLRTALEERGLHELVFLTRKLQSGVDQGTRLARQLTNFGSERVHPDEHVDINAYLESADSLLGHYLNETFQIELELEPGAPPVRVSAGILDQIVLNLAINARDAMPEGGALRISTVTKYLSEHDVRSYPNLESGRYLLLEVADEGVGIPPEVQPHIFEPFYTTKATRGGTGIGLSSIYGLMKQLGGAIFVESRPGSGSTFTLFFPLFHIAAREDIAGPGLEKLN